MDDNFVQGTFMRRLPMLDALILTGKSKLSNKSPLILKFYILMSPFHTPKCKLLESIPFMNLPR